jgi:hypothetical protein
MREASRPHCDGASWCAEERMWLRPQADETARADGGGKGGGKGGGEGGGKGGGTGGGKGWRCGWRCGYERDGISSSETVSALTCLPANQRPLSEDTHLAACGTGRGSSIPSHDMT